MERYKRLVTLSTRHLVNSSTRHLVNSSPCHLVTLSTRQPVNLPTRHLVTSSPCQLVNPSTRQLVTSSPCQLVTLSPCQLVTSSTCQLVNCHLSLRKLKKNIIHMFFFVSGPPSSSMSLFLPFPPAAGAGTCFPAGRKAGPVFIGLCPAVQPGQRFPALSGVSPSARCRFRYACARPCVPSAGHISPACSAGSTAADTVPACAESYIFHTRNNSVPLHTEL